MYFKEYRVKRKQRICGMATEQDTAASAEGWSPVAGCDGLVVWMRGGSGDGLETYGWEMREGLSEDENYMDLCSLVARNSRQVAPRQLRRRFRPTTKLYHEESFFRERRGEGVLEPFRFASCRGYLGMHRRLVALAQLCNGAHASERRRCNGGHMGCVLVRDGQILAVSVNSPVPGPARSIARHFAG
jgi:hypothetical protein